MIDILVDFVCPPRRRAWQADGDGESATSGGVVAKEEHHYPDVADMFALDVVPHGESGSASLDCLSSSYLTWGVYVQRIR